jgi:hypothetical protein
VVGFGSLGTTEETPGGFRRSSPDGGPDVIVGPHQIRPVEAAKADLDPVGGTDSCIESVLPQTAQKPRSAAGEER